MLLPAQVLFLGGDTFPCATSKSILLWFLFIYSLICIVFTDRQDFPFLFCRKLFPLSKDNKYIINKQVANIAFQCRVIVMFVSVWCLIFRERCRKPSCNWATVFLLMTPRLCTRSPLYDRGLISLYLRSPHCTCRLVGTTDCWGLLDCRGLKGSFLTTVLAVSAENCFGSTVVTVLLHTHVLSVVTDVLKVGRF